MNRPDISSDLATCIEALRVRYVASLPARRQELEALWQRLNRPPMDCGAAKDLLRMVHKLTGSAGTYGLPDLSRTALALESLLGSMFADNNGDGCWDRDRVAAQQLVEQLTRELGRHRP